VALTVKAAGSEPVPTAVAVPGAGPGDTAGTVPVIVIVGLIVGLLVVAGGFLAFVRRRGRATPS
jgi:hypothetical protein